MFSKSRDENIPPLIKNKWNVHVLLWKLIIIPIVVSLPMLLTDLGYKINGGNILNKSGF